MVVNSDTPDNVKSDVINLTIGDFGRWQLRISTLMALLKFPIAWFQLSIIFLAPPTQFFCKEFPNYTTTEWLAMKPYKGLTPKEEGLNSGYCEMLNIEGNTNETIRCPIGHDFNLTVIHSSIITEWDLVCDNKRLVDFSQISLMLGVLIGNIVFGVLADRRGRKETLLICIFLQAIFGMISAWMPYFIGFLICRFCLAVANGGTMVISFVLCMEVVGGKWRTIVPILYQIPFGFGTSVMSGLAYFYRDWRDFQLSMSLISSLFVVYIWIVPESPRWLIAVGKTEEAIQVLQKGAAINNLNPVQVSEVVNTLPKHNSKPSVTIPVLFSTEELRKRSALLCINWLVSGITFYAFSQYVGKIGSNLYFTTAISGFIACPGTLVCVYIVRKYGRRYTIAIFHLITATCFFAILAFPLGVYKQDWPRVMIASIGIVGLSVSFPALYLFTGELYPTTIRNAGVGTAVMCSRLGSMMAPLVISLQDISSFLPLVALGLGTLIEMVLILPLPETKGLPLPETLEDLEEKEDIKLNGSYISVKLDD